MREMSTLGITKVTCSGELPSGCPWCPFDRLNHSRTCALTGCVKSDYGYRPDGCPLVQSEQTNTVSKK